MPATSPKARLKEYKAKRNFSKTPEPSGDEKTKKHKELSQLSLDDRFR